MKRRTLLKGIIASVTGVVIKPSIGVSKRPDVAAVVQSPAAEGLDVEMALLDYKGKEISGNGYARQKGVFGFKDGNLTNFNTIIFEAVDAWPHASDFAFIHTGQTFITGKLAISGIELQAGDTLRFETGSINVSLS